MSKSIIFEARFEDVETAKLLGDPVNQICAALQYYQPALAPTKVRKIVFVVQQLTASHDDRLDSIDSAIQVIRLTLPTFDRAESSEARSLCAGMIGAALLKSTDNQQEVGYWRSLLAIAERNNFTASGAIRGKRAVSPIGGAVAQLFFVLERKLIVQLVVEDKNSGTRTAAFVAQYPPSLENYKDIGQINWGEKGGLRIHRARSNDYWSWDSTRPDMIEFHFARAEAGDPHGLYDLAQMYLRGTVVKVDVEYARDLLVQSASKGYKRAKDTLVRVERDILEMRLNPDSGSLT